MCPETPAVKPMTPTGFIDGGSLRGTIYGLRFIATYAVRHLVSRNL